MKSILILILFLWMGTTSAQEKLSKRIYPQYVEIRSEPQIGTVTFRIDSIQGLHGFNVAVSLEAQTISPSGKKIKVILPANYASEFMDGVTEITFNGIDLCKEYIKQDTTLLKLPTNMYDLSLFCQKLNWKVIVIKEK